MVPMTNPPPSTELPRDVETLQALVREQSLALEAALRHARAERDERDAIIARRDA